MYSMTQYYSPSEIPTLVPQYNTVDCTTNMEYNNQPQQQQQQQYYSKENSTSFNITSQQMKQKRVRTTFSADQVVRMEAQFQKKKFINGPSLKNFAAELQLNERQIKIWFQNRRTKIKKHFKATYGQKCNLKEKPTDQNGHKGIVKRLMSYSYGQQTPQSNFTTSQGPLLAESGLVTCTSHSTIGNNNHFITPRYSLLEKPLLEGYNTSSTKPEVQASLDNPNSDLNIILADLDSNCPMQSSQISSNCASSYSSTFPYPSIFN